MTDIHDYCPRGIFAIFPKCLINNTEIFLDNKKAIQKNKQSKKITNKLKKDQ